MSFKKIWDWCKEEDWIVVAIPAVMLGLVLFICKLYFWVILLSMVGATVIILEIIAIRYTGLSISDQFRTWKKLHRIASWVILVLTTLFFASLIFHLLMEI